MNSISDFIQKYKNQLSIEAFFDLDILEKKEAYLEQAFNSSPCTISLLDSRGRYLKINKNLLGITGEKESFFLGKEIGSHTGDTSMLNLIKEMDHSGETARVKMVETSFNNIKKNFYITINRVAGDNFLVIGSDITHLKDLEEQKSFNDKMTLLGEMSSFIVHEINNPLQTIALSTELIRMHSEESSEPAKLADDIELMVTTISNIISSLKVFSRKPNDEILEISMQELYNKTKVILAGKLYKHQVKIQCINLDQGVIKGSEIDLMQSLMNSISNSIDAIDKLEEKWIKVVWEDNSLKVIDSGSGISPEIEAKIFQKFYTSKGNAGNGIGLYLSKTLLNKWGYDLVYKTENGHTSFQWVKLASEIKIAS